MRVQGVTTAAVGLASLAILAGVIPGCGGGSNGNSASGAASQPQAKPKPKRQAASRAARLKIVDQNVAVLVQQKSVPIAVRARRSGSMTVRAEMVQGTQRLVAQHRFTFARRGRHKRAFALTAPMVQLMSACQPTTLKVAAGKTKTVQALKLGPPTCGRFFDDSSPFNQELPADAPLDRDDRGVTAALLAQVRDGYTKGPPPSIATTQYGVPIYSVPAGAPQAPVKINVPAWGNDVKRAFAKGAPIPANAVPATGNDAHLVVQQPATSSTWELWHASSDAGRWSGDFGGRVLRAPRFSGSYGVPGKSVAGATATGLSLLAGTITINELKRGQIDHALSMAIPRTRRSWWTEPARRSDGWINDSTGVPEGARFRLDPALDVNALGLSPAMKAIVLAAQRYGIIIRDTGGAVAFYGEDPVTYGTEDPYPTLLGGPSYEALRKFPWDKLQLTRMNLRTYEGSPFGKREPPRWPAPTGPSPLCAVPALFPCK